MKNTITLLVLLFTVGLCAQDEHFQNSSVAIEERAKEITNEYNKYLYLSDEQPVIFQKKVAEFLISKEKIKKRYEGKEMLDKLAILSEEETREMGDILTRMQLDKYRELKMKIQPLTVVDKDKM